MSVRKGQNMQFRHPCRASLHHTLRWTTGVLRIDAMMGATAKRESALRITPRQMGESVLLRVQGKLTVATVPLFSAAITKALRLDARPLVIDLREVTDVDARGIGELVKAHTLGLHHNRPIRFLIRNGRIAHLLRLAHLGEMLTLLEETTDSAMERNTERHNASHNNSPHSPRAHGAPLPLRDSGEVS